MVVETVDAETFVRNVHGAHATEPTILRCRTHAGSLVDVFTKVSWHGCPVRGLTAEIIAGALASDLGLRVATPVFVDFQDDFLEALRSVQPLLSAKFQNSVRPAFGSILIGNGYSDAQPRPPEVSTQKLAEIWAFDRLVLNPDRREAKPNCLTNGSEICLIDHEKALNCDFVGGMLNPYPWEDGKIVEADRQTPHIFRPHIQGQGSTLARLKNAWSQVDDAQIDGYAVLLPESWRLDETVINETLAYLKLLRTNLDIAFEQLSGALTT